MKLILRRAEKEDCVLLFTWVNEKEVRKNSLNSEEVLLETHTQWFQQSIRNPNIIILIGEVEGVPVGTARLTLNQPEANISYSVAKELRGRGIGKILIQNLLEWPLDTKGITYYSACVKEDNKASVKIFENLGFQKSETKTQNTILYKKEIL